MEQDRARRVVIQVSHDEHLARSRSLLLQAVGFRVLTYRVSQVGRMLLPNTVFAIFLCQTLSIEKAVLLSQSVRNLHSKMFLVRATHAPTAEEGIFDRVLHAPVGPRNLTRELLGLHCQTHLYGEDS